MKNIFENKKTQKLLIISAIIIILVINTCFIVDQRQQALVLQFGQVVRVIKKPGMKLKLPLLQEVVLFDNRVIDLEIDEQEVIASDQKRLIINAFTKYRIVDPVKFYTTVNNFHGLQSKLSSIVDSSLRQVVGGVALNELLTKNRGDIMSKIREIVGRESEIFGIKIIDVRIARADLPKENSDSIFARMQTEREKEAREIRANGAEDAATIRAEADKQESIIMAEAKKIADLTRGEGEAQASKVYAEAYSKDPEFADFYRSMNAYKESFKADKTKMVIAPENEFFKYFGNINKSN